MIKHKYKQMHEDNKVPDIMNKLNKYKTEDYNALVYISNKSDLELEKKEQKEDEKDYKVTPKPSYPCYVYNAPRKYQIIVNRR